MALHRCPSMLLVVMTVVILMGQIDQSSAKRGCSAFGHSCFGGHGKRADEDVLLLPGSESEQQPRLVFPPSESGAEEGEDRSGAYGARSASSSSGVSSLIPPPHSAQYNLSPFLRQWLQSYRRSTGDIDLQ
ncbi:neuropeptide CCHamide-2 [Periplaneta americana]|uniref:neuropeptide CCHamide-2 n=1 Tax=Periplaneta americana TaxID=6978 RepID=UPI0037E93F65